MDCTMDWMNPSEGNRLLEDWKLQDRRKLEVQEFQEGSWWAVQGYHGFLALMTGTSLFLNNFGHPASDTLHLTPDT